MNEFSLEDKKVFAEIMGETLILVQSETISHYPESRSISVIPKHYELSNGEWFENPLTHFKSILEGLSDEDLVSLECDLCDKHGIQNLSSFDTYLWIENNKEVVLRAVLEVKK